MSRFFSKASDGLRAFPSGDEHRAHRPPGSGGTQGRIGLVTRPGKHTKKMENHCFIACDCQGRNVHWSDGDHQTEPMFHFSPLKLLVECIHIHIYIHIYIYGGYHR